MNIETALGDLGVDAVTGVLLLDLLDMTPMELEAPQRFQRLKVVIDYLKQFPEDTQRFLVAKATRGKMVDRLNHMYEYVHLLSKKDSLEKSIADIDKERSAVELSNDPLLQTEVARRSLEVRTALDHIKEEISLYER